MGSAFSELCDPMGNGTLVLRNDNTDCVPLLEEKHSIFDEVYKKSVQSGLWAQRDERMLD